GIARRQQVDGLLRGAVGELLGRGLVEQALPAARCTDGFGAALDLTVLLRDDAEAKLGTHEPRPDFRAVARHDAFLVEHLGVLAARARNRGGRRPGAPLELEDEREAAFERRCGELVVARGVEAAARERDGRQIRYALGLAGGRHARGAARGVERAAHGTRLEPVRAREAPRAVDKDADADARVLADARLVDRALLDGQRAARAFVI